MYLFDHNTPSWRAYPNLVTGAITYSEDLVKHQLPYWKEVLGEYDLLSTAPPFDTIELPERIDTAILYLHTWPVEDALERHKARNGIKAKQVIYISAYRPYTELLKANGYKAVYIPMSIDVEHVKQYQQPKANHDRILYYGNVSTVKRALLKEIKDTCTKLNLDLDILSWNRWEGKKVSHEEALRIASTYNYAITVGRCTLELMALNVKQVIAGRFLGGLITNDAEFEWQREVNMNGRIWTYSNNLEECFLNIDKAIIKNSVVVNHVSEVLRHYSI
jgi:hypothetical protein